MTIAVAFELPKGRERMEEVVVMNNDAGAAGGERGVLREEVAANPNPVIGSLPSNNSLNFSFAPPPSSSTFVTPLNATTLPFANPITI